VGLHSIGKADKVAKQIGENQKLFDEVFQGVFDTDPIIRMRAAEFTLHFVLYKLHVSQTLGEMLTTMQKHKNRK